MLNVRAALSDALGFVAPATYLGARHTTAATNLAEEHPDTAIALPAGTHIPASPQACRLWG